MRFTHLIPFVLLLVVAACGTATNPTATRTGDLPVPEGGIRTLRIEALIDVQNDVRFSVLPPLFGSEPESSGLFSVKVAPHPDQRTGDPLRVTIANLGTGALSTLDVATLGGDGTQTESMALFPCEERCATELIVTVESDAAVDLVLTLQARHEALDFADDSLLIEVLDELGAPFGVDVLASSDH